ncbi:hypothetical protein FB639_005283, partial [Coemansia asiatica]
MDASGEYKGILDAVNRAINGEPLREVESGKSADVDSVEKTLHSLSESIKHSNQLTQLILENAARTSDSIKGQDQLLTKLHIRQEATSNGLNVLVNRIKELEMQYASLPRLVAQHVHALLISAQSATLAPTPASTSAPVFTHSRSQSSFPTTASLPASHAMQSSAAVTHYAGTTNALALSYPYGNPGLVARASMSGSPITPASPQNQLGSAQYVALHGTRNPAMRSSSPSVASSVSNVADSRTMTPLQHQGQAHSHSQQHLHANTHSQAQMQMPMPMQMQAQALSQDLPPEITRILQEHPWVMSLTAEQRARYVHDQTKALMAQQQQQQRLLQVQGQLPAGNNFQRQ